MQINQEIQIEIERWLETAEDMSYLRIPIEEFEEWLLNRMGKETMRFYYINNSGEAGYFTTKKTEIVKAIQSAWNIEADLYICDKLGRRNPLFFPHDNNEVSNEYLKDFNLQIIDGKKYREIRYVDSGLLAIEPDDYSEVVELI